MLLDPVTHKKSLALIAKEGKALLAKKVKGKEWNLLTCPHWIRYHKAKWALWALGYGKEPVTRFVNEDGEKLVMRGDGESPPLDEEEDAAMQRELRKSEGGGGGALVDFEGGEGGGAKKKKKSLTWKLYRKEQKKERREKAEPRRKSRKDDVERVKELRQLGRTSSEVIVPSYGRRAALSTFGLKRLRAENNPRRAAKVYKAAKRKGRA